jgi:long-chain acyl-CoA synthetase
MSATITSTADPQTLPGMIAHAARNKGPAIRFRRAGGWSRMSFANVHAQATSTARGLIDLGIHPGERVALLGGTTPDWTVADLGALCAGGVVVPIYQTNSPRECLHVLSDSGARAVIVEDAHQLAKVLEIRGDCPDLEHVIVIDPAV